MSSKAHANCSSALVASSGSMAARTPTYKGRARSGLGVRRVQMDPVIEHPFDHQVKHEAHHSAHLGRRF